MPVRTALFAAVSLFTFSAWAADPPSSGQAASNEVKPAASKSAEEFAAKSKAFNDMVAEMTTLQGQYAAATSADKKAEIAKTYNADREKADALADQLITAATKAYADAPNTDPEVTRVLVGTLVDQIESDDYERAFALGRLLIDNKCPDTVLLSGGEHPQPVYPRALAGIAAYCVNEYDLADAWLKAAKASGTLDKVCEAFSGRPYANFLNTIDESKAAWEKEKKIREAEDKAGNLPRVSLKTNRGEIVIELFENEAPNSVLNFITLVDKGFYDGLKFHRVLPGFMAQGGDPKGDGTGGPGYTIPDECNKPNHRLHFRGSLSMAHSSQPDSNGSQFFLTFLATKHLDGLHTVFGRVISGFDVLAKLKRIDPSTATSAGADKIIEAKVIRRPHEYDAKDLKKSGTHD